MSFSNTNLNYNEFDKYLNHESNDFRLFSKQNSVSNLFNYRSSSNFSLFGKNNKINETNSLKKEKTDHQIEEETLKTFNDSDPIIDKQEEINEISPKINKLKRKISSFVKKKNHKKKNVFKSLANRNLKLNMGTGLIQFIDFKRSLAKFKKNSIKYKRYNDILEYIVTQNFNFRSFLGWKSMWNDRKYGETFKKLSQKFFGDTFVYSYIFFSKIKLEYKNLYYSKIESFRKGSINPETFGPYLYNHELRK